MTITFTKVVVGILALALGILFGLPARSGRSGVKVPRWKVHGRRGDRTGVHQEEELRELERSLGRATTLRHRTRRHFTPIDLLLRRVSRETDGRRTRRYFHTVAPSRKPPDGAKGPAASTRKGNRPPP